MYEAKIGSGPFSRRLICKSTERLFKKNDEAQKPIRF